MCVCVYTKGPHHHFFHLFFFCASNQSGDENELTVADMSSDHHKTMKKEVDPVTVRASKYGLSSSVMALITSVSG